MRVGVIANTMDSVFGIAAGGHVHFLEVAKRWSELEITVFAPEAGRRLVTQSLPGATFVALPTWAVLRNRQLSNLYRSLCSLVAWRELRRCDVLLATSHFFPDLVPALCARGGRYVVTVQHLLEPPAKRPGSLLPNTISTIFQSISVAAIRWNAAAVLVNSKSVARAMRIDERRTGVYVMTHGVEHLTSEHALQTTSRRGTAMFLGRLVPTKGVDDLIRAWRLVVDRIPDARLTIAGTGDPRYVTTLKTLTADMRLTERVVFTGPLADAERLPLLSAHALFTFPSKEEGWGIVLAEAMAAGLPCITYDLPAYREVFTQGRSSVRVGDVAAFAESTIELLLDEERRRRLKAAAQQLGATFSWTAAAAIERAALTNVALKR